MYIHCAFKLYVARLCLACPFTPPSNGTASGAWNYTRELIESQHVPFDTGFGHALIAYLGKATVADIGAGVGQLGAFLMQHNSSVQWRGFDGGHNVEHLHGLNVSLRNHSGYIVPKVCWIDASQPFRLRQRPDWVISIEVGEHIPKSREATFLDNLVKNCRVGVILTWAIRAQLGYQHVNCHDNEYIINRMFERGMTYDERLSVLFRSTVNKLPWLANTIMVFKK